VATPPVTGLGKITGVPADASGVGVAVMMGLAVGVEVAVKTTRVTEELLEEAVPPV